MKGIFKKTLSMALCLIMVFTVFQGTILSTSAKNVGPDKKTQLTISPDKSSYSWGDTLVFTVEVKNVTKETLTGIKIYSLSRNYTNVAWQGDLPVIESLEPGKTETVQITYNTTKVTGLMAIILPIIWIFDPYAKNAYRESRFNYEKSVKIGLFSYKVGFEVEYGEETFGDPSNYEPGDYTASLKKLMYSNSYTMACDLYFDGEKPAGLITYVDGDKRAFHMTVDINDFLANIGGKISDEAFNMLKSVNKAHIVYKDERCFVIVPQINIYVELSNDRISSGLLKALDTMFIEGDFIGSETALGGITTESFKAKDGRIIHYRYKDGKFVGVNTQSGEKITVLYEVKSITKDVKNKWVFDEPYATQMKISFDTDLFDFVA